MSARAAFASPPRALAPRGGGAGRRRQPRLRARRRRLRLRARRVARGADHDRRRLRVAQPGRRRHARRGPPDRRERAHAAPAAPVPARRRPHRRAAGDREGRQPQLRRAARAAGVARRHEDRLPLLQHGRAERPRAHRPSPTRSVDQGTEPGVFADALGGYLTPSWTADGRVLVFYGAQRTSHVGIDTLGAGYADWFGDPAVETLLTDGELTRAGDKLVAVGDQNDLRFYDAQRAAALCDDRLQRRRQRPHVVTGRQRAGVGGGGRHPRRHRSPTPPRARRWRGRW